MSLKIHLFRYYTVFFKATLSQLSEETHLYENSWETHTDISIYLND